MLVKDMCWGGAHNAHTSTPDRMLTMTGKSCNRETSAKERMMVLLCEQVSHQQIGVDHGWKIIEMALF